MREDVTIIGAGIVGLATAWQLIQREEDLHILILEKESQPVPHQSSHNSGVLHSGIYYEPGSLKARLCVSGHRKMVDFCKEQGLPYRLQGKFIIAQNAAEEQRLATILNNGRENGLRGLEWRNAEEIRREEPDIQCSGGIWVPQAGITDFGRVGKRLSSLLKKKGVKIAYNSKVEDIHPTAGCIEIATKNQLFKSRTIVNCAGLHSDRIAKLTHPDLPYRIIPFRGEYYRLSRKWKDRVKHLIYPTPNPDLPFLGIHLTQQLDGSITAGPNAILALSREGYTRRDFNFNDVISSLFYPGFFKLVARFGWAGLAEMRKAYFERAFAREVRKILPDISANDLVKSRSGVRAQAVSRSGELIDDFLFLEGEGIVHVCNAPSPAATASLAIGEVIAEKVEKHLQTSYK